MPTWRDAVDSLEVERGGPAHVLRFGKQSDIQGLIAGTSDADRRIGYLTKYLTKAIVDPIDDEADASSRREAHIDRLHREVRHLPCSPKCWNWLHYGVQPKDADAGMVPGQCPSKAHDREHLGCGGRRVLVSRKWTGKTLTEHKADRYSAVRTVSRRPGSTCRRPTAVRQPRPTPMEARGSSGKPSTSTTSLPITTSSPKPSPNATDGATSTRRPSDEQDHHSATQQTAGQRDREETGNMITKRWYTVAEAAEMLGFGLSKTKMLVATGALRSVKDGRHRRILLAWVDEYIARRIADEDAA